jgi:chromosomal replication initiation ATPase DnaA
MKKPIFLYGPYSSGKSHIADAFRNSVGIDNAVLISANAMPSKYIHGEEGEKRTERLKEILVTKDLLIIEEVTCYGQMNDFFYYLKGMIDVLQTDIQIIFTSSRDCMPQPNMLCIETTYHLKSQRRDQ